MLNYVWTALLVLGITVALINDFSDSSSNKYKNDEFISVKIENVRKEKNKFTGLLKIDNEKFNNFYNVNEKDIKSHNITFNVVDNKIPSVYFKVNKESPAIWKDMAKVNGKEDDLTGSAKNVVFVDSTTIKCLLTLEKIKFVKMKDVTNSALSYAGTSVNIALGLIGIMALWLGIMKIAENAGLIKIIAKVVKPVTRLLFPDVPSDHPAIGAIIMNMSANMLGLGNAATPFGLKAMEELEKINPHKGTASNAMCTFLTINTAGFTLIPATAIAIRASAGSSDPAIIIGTSAFGAICATIVGLTSTKILEKFTAVEKTSFNKKGLLKLLAIAFIFISLTILLVKIGTSTFAGFFNPETFKTVIQVISTLAIPMIILSFVIYGLIKKVKVYEAFVEGAKEGFNVAIKIIPYLVAMLVAIGIFRAGGAMEILVSALTPLTKLIGMPAEALPMALMRPLSGSGSLGIMAEIIATHGPDSLIGIMVSTFFGSTETTFYVLAVYFGAAGINKTRHALLSGLLADVAGILAAVFIVNLLFGGL